MRHDRLSLVMGVLALAGLGALYVLQPDTRAIEKEVQGLGGKITDLSTEVEQLRKALAHQGVQIREPDGTVRTTNEPTRPIRSLLVLPLVSDNPPSELPNLNRNLGRLLRDNLDLKVLLTDEDADRNDPLALGKKLGADAVLFGEVSAFPFVKQTEYVFVNLQETATGRSLWSYRVTLRRAGEEDRSEIPLKLQNFPGQVVGELSARWPRK